MKHLRTAKGQQGARSRPASAENRVTLRDQQKELTRTRLIDAARELFNELGVQHTTIDQIARHAGTTRATFYLHFENKAEIASHFVSIYSEEAVTGIRAMFTAGRASKASIAAWLRDVSVFCQSHGTNLVEIEPLLVGEKDYMSKMVRDSHGVVLAGFEPFIARFRGAEQDRVRAELLLQLILTQRYLFIGVIHEIEFPEKRVFDSLVDMWHRILSRTPRRPAG